VLIGDVGGMTALNDRRFVISPKYSATVTITGATKANPCVITTSTDHGFAVGDRVLIENVGGMTEINNLELTVGRNLAASKAVQYTVLSGSNAVQLDFSSAHGYATGDQVYVSGFGEATQLNGNTYTITVTQSDRFTLNGTNSSTITRPWLHDGNNYYDGGSPIVQKVNLNKFELTGIDSSAYGAYTSGGTAKEVFANQFELDSENSSGYSAFTSGGTATRVVVNEFDLEGENGLTHTAYTSGGTVKAVSRTSMKLQTLAGVDVNSTAYGAYTSGGTMTAIHEIASPYDIGDLFDADGLPLLQIAQSHDYLFLAHPDYHPRQLTRSGHADWEIEDFVNEEGPFLDENLTDITIYVQDSDTLTLTPGSVVTLVSSEPLWEADHVGAMWQLRLKDGATSPVWQSATAFTIGHEVMSGDLFYRCTDAGTSGTEAPTHDVGDAYDGPATGTNCKWRYIHNGRGIVIITSFTSSQQVTATVISEIPAGCVGEDNESGRWNEGAWSEVQGYPRAVAMHEGRLVWGCTEQEPLCMDFSATESLFLYNPVELNGTVARSTAFRRVLDGDNPIRWMRSTERGLIVGTLAGEWVVGTEGSSEQGFGPDTAVARPFSSTARRRSSPCATATASFTPSARARRCATSRSRSTSRSWSPPTATLPPTTSFSRASRPSPMRKSRTG
jgi:hypothetical protein